MKRPSLRILSTGAIFGLLSMTPAFAQVAGNLGDLHTQTLYMQQYHELRGYTARAPESAKTGAANGAPPIVDKISGREKRTDGDVTEVRLARIKVMDQVAAARRRLRSRLESATARLGERGCFWIEAAKQQWLGETRSCRKSEIRLSLPYEQFCASACQTAGVPCPRFS
jgi:hypothetical protein